MNLQDSQNCKNMIVIMNWLEKKVIADELQQINLKSVMKWFLQHYYSHHFLSHVIVSDKDTQFVSMYWARVCSLLQIKRQLLTAYFLETDDFTECMNQELENFFQEYVNYTQDDWKQWLEIAVSTLCEWDFLVMSTSFFFITHEWSSSKIQ